MPLYTCIADARTPTPVRAAIAKAITDTHCGHTGAPPQFVHVIFNEYLGNRADVRLRVVGTIRAGRPKPLKDKLHAELVSEIAKALSAPLRFVEVTLQEVPAEWAMEGGEVLPAPGSEADWLAANWSEP